MSAKEDSGCSGGCEPKVLWVAEQGDRPEFWEERPPETCVELPRERLEAVSLEEKENSLWFALLQWDEGRITFGQGLQPGQWTVRESFTGSTPALLLCFSPSWPSLFLFC